MPKKFTSELHERAVRLFLERRAVEGGRRSFLTRAIAPQVGVGEETLRMWCNRYRHEVEQTPAAETPAEADMANAAVGMLLIKPLLWARGGAGAPGPLDRSRV